MPTLRMREITNFDNKMDKYIEDTKALTSSLGVRLLNYMQVESMSDVDGM